MVKMTSSYKMQHRRRREEKTNYKRRLALLKSGKIRVVIRRTSKNMNVQLIEYDPKGDKMLSSANTTELVKLGFSRGGNTPAAYLVGLLAAKKAAGKVKEAILDLGLQTNVRGSRIYSALKGVIDGGINVPCSEDIFPKQDRLEGKHISEKIAADFQVVKEKILKM
jgi:large subunit ribosomal protein L18